MSGHFSMQAPIIWAQRKDKVLATVSVLDCKDPTLKIEGTKFSFAGKSHGTDYKCEVELFAEVDETQSLYVVRQRGIELSLKKKDESVWWPRLAKTTTKLNWITVDWAKWVDSSDDDEDEGYNWGDSMPFSFGGEGDDDGEEEAMGELEEVKTEEEEAKEQDK